MNRNADLAAKSLGYKGVERRKGRLVAFGHPTKKSRQFNPKVSKAAIFDLIAHHNMGVHFETQTMLGYITKRVEVYFDHDEDGVCKVSEAVYEIDSDKGEALRRAVLCAAAKIGEGVE